MADIEACPSPREYLSSLRHHVREPVSNALDRSRRERREVERERDAFEVFAERVDDLPAMSVSQASVPAMTVRSSPTVADADALRRLYAETVTAVPHYERVYDEPITTNVRAELGPEIAALFEQTASGAGLVPTQQQAIVSAARQAATDRAEFCDTLEAEVASLQSLREDLTAVLDELDSTIVPPWYYQQFRDNLSSIITTRQAQLTARSVAYLDGHNFCESLYSDEAHTYPVLKAVARLLDCVTVGD
jgi:hypothetical protein